LVVVGALAVAVLAGAVKASVGEGTPADHDVFSARVDPGSVASGGVRHFTVRIGGVAHGEMPLGGAVIHAPSSFHLVGASASGGRASVSGGRVVLPHLNVGPGQTLRVRLTVRIPQTCTTATRNWRISAYEQGNERLSLVTAHSKLSTRVLDSCPPPKPHTATVKATCTGVSFSYRNFPHATNAVLQMISIDNVQVYKATYTFTGPTSTNTVPIVVSAGGVHHVDGHASWHLDKSGSADSGNTSVSGCHPPATHLKFVTQPTDAEVGQPITGTANTASGPPVSVELLDANGNLAASGAPVTISVVGGTAGAALGGTKTVSASGGMASFSDLTLNKAGYGYTLSASSGGASSATSTSFNEYDVSTSVACRENVNCSANPDDPTQQGTQTSQNLNAAAIFDPNNPDAGQLEVALNRSQTYWAAHAAQCGNYAFLRSDTDVVFMTANTRSKTFVDTFTVRAINFSAISQLINQQQYCFVASFPFTTKTGSAQPTTLPDGSPGFIGLLRDCNTVTNQPCISARNGLLGGLFGTVSITITIPAGESGDPQGRG
jgi:hypothetical protein